MTPERTERLYQTMAAFYARCWELSRVAGAVQRVRACLEDSDGSGDLRPLLTEADVRRLEAGCRAALANVHENAAAAAEARLLQVKGDPVLRARIFGSLQELQDKKGTMTARDRGEVLHNVFQYLLVDQAPGVGGAEKMEAWKAAVKGRPAGIPESDEARLERALRQAVLLALHHATSQGTLANAIHFARSCQGLSPDAQAECVRAWEAARYEVELLEYFHQACGSPPQNENEKM